MFLRERKIFLVCFLLLLNLLCRSQICTGSLGDPVINVTFGAGANQGQPLPGNITNYRYYGADCPQDGLYTIANSTFGCNNSTWHDLTEDHTPNDVKGYMMIVNASFSPGDFYVDTVHGLCANTTYEFAAWILNILKPYACSANGIKPNLTFNIETQAGIVLGTYRTGDIPQSPSPVWNQHGLFFKTPAGIENVVLRITNNAPGGCGNDLVLDDITFRPCGTVVNAAINLNGSVTNVDYCQEDTRKFDLSASLADYYVHPAYQWQLSKDSIQWTDIPGATTLNYSTVIASAGNYFYRLAVAEAGNISSASCRISSNVLGIHANSKPVVDLSVSGPACDGSPLTLTAHGGSKYNWSGPENFSSSLSNPVKKMTLQSGGTYYVTVTSDKGCEKSDSISLVVSPKPHASAGNDETICEGSTTILHATGGITDVWSPATSISSTTSASPAVRPSDTITYTLVVTDNNGCMDTAKVTINVLKAPQANAGPDRSIFEGQSDTLKGSAKGTAVNFFWTPASFINNSTVLSPIVHPPDNTTFTLHVVSNVGCGSAQDDVFVRVYKKVEIPNAFSPNGDGINDVWRIAALQTYPECDLSVFNRYGQEVYRSKGYDRPWDGTYNGKPLPTGTYYYVLDLKHNIPVLSGWVLIVR